MSQSTPTLDLVINVLKRLLQKVNANPTPTNINAFSQCFKAFLAVHESELPGEDANLLLAENGLSTAVDVSAGNDEAPDPNRLSLFDRTAIPKVDEVELKTSLGYTAGIDPIEENDTPRSEALPTDNSWDTGVPLDEQGFDNEVPTQEGNALARDFPM